MRISGVTYAPRKTHRMRNIILIIFILTLIAAIAVASISAYIGWKLIHPEKTLIQPFGSNIVPEYKEISFYSLDKTTKLSGWYFKVKDSDKTIILSHSYGKNRLQFEKEQSINMIKEFLNKKYNVLTFDFRNSGKSDGNSTTFGYMEKSDLLSAIDQAKKQGSKHIVLMGFSMGATTSILAAPESLEVDAVIADSPYSSLKSYLNTGLSFKYLPDIIFNETVPFSVKTWTGMEKDSLNTVNALESLAQKPILLIHGKSDNVVPISSSREIYTNYLATSNKIEIWEVDNADHLASYETFPGEYMDRVFKFLEKVYKE